MTSILSVSAYTGFAVRPVRHMNLMRVCWHDISYRTFVVGWWRGSVVERRSLAGELSLSYARPAADG